MSGLSLILGRPLATREQKQVRIGVLTAVAALGLDALSSAAYGPEAALAMLSPLGAAGVWYILPIMAVILLLLGMLYFSYRQTVEAYPVNGSSYTVARENLGVWAGLIAAAALMIDYILNVAVGISAGVAALVSAVPELQSYTMWVCLGILLIITVLNLRGTREAGVVFSIPTYLFVVSIVVVIGIGLVRTVFSGGAPRAVVPPPVLGHATRAMSVWLLLRAFASGCTAMTGVEAVSNGVSAFKDPTVKHARRTLTMIVVILALLLGGIATLTTVYHIGALPQDQPGYQSVLSQLTAAVAGRGWFYYVAIGAMLTTLCLSANTSFVDFPRLGQLIARDGYLPRSFAVAGRRLVFTVGILFLAAAAGALLVIFGGITDRLIPLFAVGAFSAFTLSQAGMVMHWHRARGSAGREGGRRASHSLRLAVNLLGAVMTGIALAVILAAKFIEGAWITLIAVPSFLAIFYIVHRHYAKIDREVKAHEPLDLGNNPRPIVLMPVAGWNRITAKALRFSMWLSTEIVAVHAIRLTGEEADDESEHVRREWAENVEAAARRHGVPVPELRIVQTPYRRFVPPLLAEIDRLKKMDPRRAVSVVIPDVVERRWWDVFLHRRKPVRLRKALMKRGDYQIVVITVPWFPAGG